MPVYLVTGKLGSGKTLACVSKIQMYLNRGAKVATNLDLNMDKLVSKWNKTSVVYRLPDKPVVDDLNALPQAYEGDYDESKSGALVLDECGTWFNTRGFNDKSRQPLINKLLHIRKLGWDVFFIVQHIEMIDKQIREGLGEHVVTCMRADRLPIPGIGLFLKMFSISTRMPKLHIAIVKYGTTHNAPVVDRWVYRGTHLYEAYDTRQVFGASDQSINQLLMPYYTHGRYITKAEYAKQQYKAAFHKIASIFNKKFIILLSFITCLLAGAHRLQAGTTEPRTGEPATEQKEPQQTEVIDVHVVGFIGMTNDFLYLIARKDTGEVIDIEQAGYQIRAIDYCSARLIKFNVSQVVTCDNPIAIPAYAVSAGAG